MGVHFSGTSELYYIYKELKFISDRMREQDMDGSYEDEWKYPPSSSTERARGFFWRSEHRLLGHNLLGAGHLLRSGRPSQRMMTSAVMTKQRLPPQSKVQTDNTHKNSIHPNPSCLMTIYTFLKYQIKFAER